MRGNSAILKCTIPSFVADFVYVVSWLDEDGKEFTNSSDYNSGTKAIKKTIFVMKSFLKP